MFIPTLKQKHYQLLAGAWAMVITLASSIPNLQIQSTIGIPEVDKFIHIAIFAILAYLLAGSMDEYIKSWKVVAQILLVLIFTTILGFLDELHQSIVVGRNSSLRDLLADGVGGFLGTVTYLSFQNRLKN